MAYDGEKFKGYALLLALATSETAVSCWPSHSHSLECVWGSSGEMTLAEDAVDPVLSLSEVGSKNNRQRVCQGLHNVQQVPPSVMSHGDCT